MSNTTVEIRNQIPFPIKVFRKDAQGTERLCNLLDGYRRYVQEAASGETLIMKLAFEPQWELSRITVGEVPQTCVIGTDVLRSRSSGGQSIQVKLDLPVRDVALFTVDDKGQRLPLPAHVGDTVSLPEGTLIEARGSRDNHPYCWLIITPKGQANVLGQIFTTGTGWSVAPQVGEVVLFFDLALGQAASWQPTAAPSNPFYFVLHGDVGDLSTLLSSHFADIASPLRTPANDMTRGSSAARPATLDQFLQQQPPPAQGGRLKSAGPFLLKALAGPGTRVAFYEHARFTGASFVPDDTGSLPKNVKASSINMEVTQTQAEAGIRVFTTLSEDYEADAKGELQSVTRFRSSLVFPPNVQSVELSAWEDGTQIEVDGKKYSIGPSQPAKLSPNQASRIVVRMTAEEAGAPELIVRTDTMPPGAVVMVYPDQEMHEKIASLPDNALQKSGLVNPKYSQDDCKQVQLALKSISQTMVHGHAETTAGVSSTRHIDASQMNDAHWVLSLDPASGKVAYQAVDAQEAARINATASKEVVKAGASLAQGFNIKKSFKKVTKVVVSTGSSAVNTVSNTAQDAAKTVSNTAQDAAKTVSNTAQDAAKATGDAIVDAAKSVSKQLVVTVHFLEDNVPGFQFVVNQAKHAAMAIKAVIEMVEVAVEKFVEWVRFIFDWGDIRQTQKVIVSTVRNGLKGWSQDVIKVKNSIDKAIEHLKQALAKAESTAAITSTSQASNPTSHSSTEKFEWFMDLLSKHSKDTQSDSGSTSTVSKNAGEQFIADMKRAVGNIGQDLFGIDKSIDRLSDALIRCDASAAFIAAKDTAIQIIALGLDVVRAVIDVLLDGIAALIEGLLSLLTAKIRIPYISDLLKKYLGIGEMSALDIGALIMAIPVTIGTKLLTGRAPFKGVDSLALGVDRGVEVGKTLALGVVALMDGFMNAYSTLKATGATAAISTPASSGSKFAAAIRILKLIASTVQLFGYIGAGLILNDEGAAAIVYTFSAIRAWVKVRTLMLPEQGIFDQFDAAADAVLGAIKVIAGCIEAGTGHGLEGSICILEGAGKVAVLGGFTENPLVIAGAVTASVAAPWAASSLYFVRAGKL